MGLPKVLIVTGYYNREWCVKESMQSLVNQNYDNVHIIAFDDCSTDETYTLLKEFNSDKFTALLLPQNMGFVRGLIYVLDNFSKNYDYIAIHGSGDISLPTRIQKQVAAFEQDRDLTIVSCKIANIDQYNGTRKEVLLKDYYSLIDVLKKNPFSHGEVMFRRDQYNLVGGYRPIFYFSQDYDLWLRLLRNGKAKVIQEVLYERQIQFDGVSYNPKKIIRQEMFAFLARHLNTMNPEDQKMLVKDMTEGKTIFEVVNPHDKAIQKNLFIRYNVLIAKNQTVNTEIFIDNSEKFYKFYYQVMHLAVKSAFFRLSINTLYKMIMKLKLLTKDK